MRTAGTMSLKELRENDRLNKEAWKEWTRELGHKPTSEDMMRILCTGREAGGEEIREANSRAWQKRRPRLGGERSKLQRG